MTTPNAEQLGPEDFDDCFTGEPELPDAGQDLARGRQRRRRGRVAVAGTVVAVTAAGLLGVALAAQPGQTGVPATGPSSSASPSAPPSATPTTSPGPRRADTAPKLTYTPSQGYLDRNGVGWDGSSDGFRATTKHTYDLVRAHLDPEHEHLAPYEAYAFTGGGGSYGGLQVGQKLSWTVAGQAGEGMLLVSVTRAAPGERPVTTGEERDGLCAGAFVEAACEPEVIDGQQVFLHSEPGSGFVVDLLQADGELASAWVTPLFANNTDVPLEDMGVELPAVLELLADPELDVVG